MKVAFYISSPRDVDIIRPIVSWLDRYLVFTDNNACIRFLKKYEVKFKFIKDYRILVWEVAKYCPSVFVDLSLRPYLFPRNGSTTVYIPNNFNLYISNDLMFYDFILVSNNYNMKLLTDFGIVPEKIAIMGYPRFDLAARQEEVLLTKAEEKVFKKYAETNKHLNINAGLKIASFIKKEGNRNLFHMLQPDLNKSHQYKPRNTEKSLSGVKSPSETDQAKDENNE